MKSLLIVICTFCFSVVHAQVNLVPNGGFTNYSTCPTSQGQIESAIPWYDPINFALGSDLYHTCNGSVPSSTSIYQQDHTPVTNGGYAGLYAYIVPGCNYCGELIQAELLDSLLADTFYCVEYYASLSDHSDIAITSLGALFSDTAFILEPFDPIPGVASIESPDTVFLEDKTNWMHVSGIYKAHGGEKFLTIGYFRDSTNTSYITVANNFPTDFAYYLIDDVSVYNCNNLVGNVEPKKEDFKIYPNPASDIIYIENAGNNKCFFYLSDAWGNLIIKKTINSKARIDVSEFTAGIYFYRMKDSNSNITQGKISIIH